MTVAAIYLRLSQDDDREGESLSIEGQRKDCTAYAERMGWEVREFVDPDHSGSKGLPRPAYEAMLNAVTMGEVAAVIAAKQDRFTRLGTEWETFKATCLLSEVSAHTVEAGDLKLETASGMLSADIRSVFAAYEARMIGSRVKRGLETARGRGDWTASTTFGYDKGGVVNRVQAKWIRWAFDQIINHGASLSDVLKAYRANGVLTARGNPWSDLGTLSVTLKSPTIAGINTYKGEDLGDGNWTPIVSREERETLIGVLASRSKRGKGHGDRPARRYALAGLVLCGTPECDLRVMKSRAPGRDRAYSWRCSVQYGGCGNHFPGAELDSLATAIALQIISDQQAGDVSPMPEFDESEIRDVEAEIASTRGLVVQGLLKASDAAAILKGLNDRMDTLQAARDAHTEAAEERSTWHRVTRQGLFDESDPHRLRGLLDNVVVQPGRAGLKFEAKTGWTRAVMPTPEGGWQVMG